MITEFCNAYTLTPREAQMIALICRGMKNAAIAADLGVSGATVRLHIRNVHRKVKTGDKVELVLKLWDWSLDNHIMPMGR